MKTVIAGRRSLALTHWQGRYGARDNRCPHQGGPLREGSIEKRWLRCLWHDHDPLTGQPPAGFSDAPSCVPVEVRTDGVYVGIEDEPPHERTVSDLVAETLVSWGVTHVFDMVVHSNLGSADAMRRQEEAPWARRPRATPSKAWPASPTWSSTSLERQPGTPHAAAADWSRSPHRRPCATASGYT